MFLGLAKTKPTDPVPPEVREKETKAVKRIEEIKQEAKADQATKNSLDARVDRLKKRQNERKGNNAKN
jgi:hypothetical protein